MPLRHIELRYQHTVYKQLYEAINKFFLKQLLRKCDLHSNLHLFAAQIESAANIIVAQMQ